MIAISPKRKTKTLVSLPSDLLTRGKQVATSHSVSFSEYLSLLLEADLATRVLHRRASGIVPLAEKS